jgi:hypothetical protein
MNKYIIISLIMILLDGIYLYNIKDIANRQIMLVQNAPINMKILSTIICYIFLVFGLNYFIINENKTAYDALICMRYDGRDLNIKPWVAQKEFRVGYHYKPTPEEAVQGLALLEGLKEHCPPPKEVLYPDLRTITIKD